MKGRFHVVQETLGVISTRRESPLGSPRTWLLAFGPALLALLVYYLVGARR